MLLAKVQTTLGNKTHNENMLIQSVLAQVCKNAKDLYLDCHNRRQSDKSRVPYNANNLTEARATLRKN